MAIFEGSRYEYTPVKYYRGDDGSLRQTICPTADDPPTLTFAYSPYVCVAGDRVDLLADRFFGDPELWWAIADANPHWLFYGFLPAGLTLRIPNGVPQR